MRDYELQRFASRKESTASLLYAVGAQNLYAPRMPAIARSFRCFIVEDQYQPGSKVPGETRIPPGRYEIKLRKEGALNVKYAAKYPNHRGMLWLQNVPNFTWVYIHTGNKESETDACLLTGDGMTRTELGEYETTGSVAAYQRLYLEMAAAMDREQVFINVVDVG